MLEFRNVSKTFQSHSRKGLQSVQALKSVSFIVDRGEFVSVVGKSGAGKTTLVKLLIGAEKPDSGSILFQGADVCLMRGSNLQMVRRKIGVIYQDYKLLYKKTTAENVAYIMQVLGLSDESIIRDVPRVLEIVGLDQRADNFPEELSGGEQQRLAIARALVHRPELIVADEPTGNLDPYNTYEVINLLKRINQLGDGTTVILLTHNKEVVDFLKKRVITLEKGEIINDSPKGKFIL